VVSREALPLGIQKFAQGWIQTDCDNFQIFMHKISEGCNWQTFFHNLIFAARIPNAAATLFNFHSSKLDIHQSRIQMQKRGRNFFQPRLFPHFLVLVGRRCCAADWLTGRSALPF
jgi:hypothetical protein